MALDGNMAEKKREEEDELEEENSLMEEIRSRYTAARDHRRSWRTEARECYRFYAGDHYTPEEKSILQAQLRPTIVFNFTGPLVEAVIGQEVNNRQEVRYIPRTSGDAMVNELVTEVSRFFGDQCDLENEQTDAFRDCVICGEGWTVTRLSDERNPAYDPIGERVDPLEMLPDPSSQKPNYSDARYLFREKRMDKQEAKSLFPEWDGVTGGEEWDFDDSEEAGHAFSARESYTEKNDDIRAVNRDIKVLEYQYKDIETYYIVQNTETGDVKELDEEDFDEIREDIDKSDNIDYIPKRKYIHKRAFIIGQQIVHEDEVCPTAFTYEGLTGKRDREKGYWFGVVRSCLDPQRWANKWLSQIMHILNSSAKGGVMVEKSAVDNISEFEAKWAKPGSVSIVNDGALQNKMIQMKEPAAYPPGFEKLMEYAKQSFYDVTGINAELLGMADREQPGVLEYQRKQSAVSLLAPLFDSLRHYRKRFGRTWLWMIREYVADGRMIRITMDQQNQVYMPVLPQLFGDQGHETQEYDIIVDQAPTAPNLQEATWAVMNTLGPLLKDMIGPEDVAIMLDATPLPESVKAKLRESQQKRAQNPQPNPEMMKAQMDMQVAQQKAQLDSQSKQADMQMKQQEFQMEMEFKKMELAMELQAMREKAMLERDIKMGEAQMQMQAMAAKTNAEITVAEQKVNSDLAVNEAKAEQQMQLTEQQAGQQYRQQEAQGKLKYEQAKQMAKAKPKGNKNGS
jgi:hypothetical protein